MAKSAPKARERKRRWVAKNPERAKEWRDANPGRATEFTRAWTLRNPDKRRAQNTVANALRDGHMTRPTTCSVCGAEPLPNARGASRIEAHHGDYARPLEVVWLCKPCHKELHRKNEQEAA